MNEFMEKLIARLEDNRRTIVTNDEDLEWNRAVYSCTEIVKELAEEHKGGWILCSEKLPEDNVKVLVTYIYENKLYSDEILHRHDDGWYFGDDVDEMSYPSEVIAWQPLPEKLYQPKGE